MENVDAWTILHIYQQLNYGYVILIKRVNICRIFNDVITPLWGGSEIEIKHIS
jgi:hypothetical protein